jgi:hypothetical protein
MSRPLFGDAGSSWCKVFRAGDDAVRVLRTREALASDLGFDWGTGHTARGRSARFENDLISLSKGALALVDEADFTVLDLGSRDAKLVAFRDRRPVRLDWSVGCAAATGATVEMLAKFYDLDLERVPAVEDWSPVTCGTYAVERIMDAVSGGGDVHRAVGRFLHGLARSSLAFAGDPGRLYLSGGFTLVAPFEAQLARYAEVRSLGRFAPLAGLWAFAAEADPALGPIPAALAPPPGGSTGGTRC